METYENDMTVMDLESMIGERHKLDDCWTLISNQLFRLEKLAAHVRSIFSIGDVVKDSAGDLWVLSDLSIIGNDIIHGEIAYFGKPLDKKAVSTTINLCGGKEVTFDCTEFKITSPFYAVTSTTKPFKQEDMALIIEEWRQWDSEREECWDAQQRVDSSIAKKLAEYDMGVHTFSVDATPYKLSREENRIGLCCTSGKRPSLYAHF